MKALQKITLLVLCLSFEIFCMEKQELLLPVFQASFHELNLGYMQHSNNDKYLKAKNLLSDPQTRLQGLQELTKLACQQEPHHLALLDLGKHSLVVKKDIECAKALFTWCMHPEAKTHLAQLLLDEGDDCQARKILQEATQPYQFSLDSRVTDITGYYLTLWRYYHLPAFKLMKELEKKEKKEGEGKEKKAQEDLAAAMRRAETHMQNVQRMAQTVPIFLASAFFEREKTDEGLEQIDRLIQQPCEIEGAAQQVQRRNIQQLKKISYKNAEAFFLIYQIYRNGFGVNVDQIEADRYLRNAARLGDIRAQFELACQRQSVDLEKLFEIMKSAKAGKKEYEQRIYQQAKQKLIEQALGSSEALGSYLLFMDEAESNEVDRALEYLQKAEQSRMCAEPSTIARKKQEAIEGRIVATLMELSQRSNHALDSLGDFWLVRAQNTNDKEASRKAFNATRKLLEKVGSDESAEKLKKAGLNRLHELVELDSRQALAELLIIYATGQHGIACPKEKLAKLVPLLMDSTLEVLDQRALTSLMDFAQLQVDDPEFRYNVASRTISCQAIGKQTRAQAEQLLNALVEQAHEGAIYCLFSVLSRRPENFTKLVEHFEQTCKLNKNDSLSHVIREVVVQMEQAAAQDCRIGRFVASIYQTGIPGVLEVDREKAILLLKKNAEKRDRVSALQLGEWYVEGKGEVCQDDGEAVGYLSVVTDDSHLEEALLERGIAALEYLHQKKKMKATQQLLKVLFSKKSFHTRGLEFLLDAYHRFRDEDATIVLDLLPEGVSKTLESLVQTDSFARVLRGLMFFDKAEKTSDEKWSKALRAKAAGCIDQGYDQLKIDDVSVQESCNVALREYFFRQGQFFLFEGDVARVEHYTQQARKLGDKRLVFAFGKFLTEFKQTQENYKKGISYLVEALDTQMSLDAALLLAKYIDYFPNLCAEVKVPKERVVEVLEKQHACSLRLNFFRQFCKASITRKFLKVEEVKAQHEELLVVQNDSDALYVMGLAHYFAADFAKAYAYFDEEALQGDPCASGLKGMMLYLGLGITQDLKVGREFLERFMVYADRCSSFDECYVLEVIHSKLHELSNDLVAQYFIMRFDLGAYKRLKQFSILNDLLVLYAQGISELNNLLDGEECQELRSRFVSVLRELAVYKDVSPNVNINFATTYFYAARSKRALPDEPFDKRRYLEEAFSYIKKVFTFRIEGCRSKIESITFDIYRELLTVYREFQDKGKIKKLLDDMQKLGFDPKSKIAYLVALDYLNELKDDKKTVDKSMERLMQLADAGNPFASLRIAHSLSNNLILTLAYFETAMDNADDDVWYLIEQGGVPNLLKKEFEILKKDGKSKSFTQKNKLTINIIFARFYAGLLARLLKRDPKDTKKIEELKSNLNSYLKPLLESKDPFIEQCRNQARCLKIITDWRLQKKTKESVAKSIPELVNWIQVCTVPVENGLFKFPVVQQNTQEICNDLKALCNDENTKYSKEDIEYFRLLHNCLMDCLLTKNVMIQSDYVRERGPISSNNPAFPTSASGYGGQAPSACFGLSAEVRT